MTARTALREEDGFTLVETIVAFAILALVVSAAVEIVGNGSFRERFDRARMMALSHAQSELAMISATGLVAPGSVEGRFADGYAWRVTAAPLVVPADVQSTPVVASEEGTVPPAASVPPRRPFAVSIEVFAGGATGESVTLRTVVIGRSGG